MTIFIIIGIIIVAGIISYFMVRQNLSKPIIDSEFEPIYNFVEGCIKESFMNIIPSIGFGGGYYFPPELSTELGVPYYYIDGKTHIPSKLQIEEEISKVVSGEIYGCVRAFEDFSDYQIQEGDIETQTRILDNEIILNINYPLTITKGEKTISFERFNNLRFPIRLGFIYNSVDEITKNQLENEKYSIDGEVKEAYCIECISDIINKNDLKLNIVNAEEGVVIFNVVDEDSKINNLPFEFRFANKYQIG